MSANEKQIGGEHYRQAIQVWDFIVQNNICYLGGNMIKYICRIGRKGDAKKWIEDLDKVIHYAEKWKETIRASL